MRFQPCHLGAFCLAVSLAWCSQVAAQEEIERFVEFRDGTRLLMTFQNEEIPWQRTLPDGQIETSTISLADCEDLQLVYISPSRKLELIRRALEHMQSGDYLQREMAQQEIMRLGGRFVPVLEQALAAGGEVDYLWRLSEILSEISAVAAEKDPGDRYLDSQGNLLEGDIADWAPTATAHGQTFALDRSLVARITRQADPNTLLAGPAVGLVRRIGVEESDARFAGATRIDFETGPEGSPLKGAEDVGQMFVPWGCVLESSYPRSPVALQDGFHVHGPSRGFCAANQSPLYRGVMTIRFCQPNEIDAPAGVRLVGLWVAEVKPGGTTLEAYDSTGRLLTSLATTRRGSEFLAIESAVPIANLKIVPNEDPTDHKTYDPNFAIDDLMFETPLAFSQDFEQYTVVLEGGEVLRGNQFEVVGEEFRLAQLSVGVEEVRQPFSQVRALLPKCYSAETATLSGGFVMLADGSVLRTLATPEGLRLARLPEAAPLDPSEIVALWGESTSFVAAPAEWEGNHPLLLTAREEKQLGELTWGETYIEAEGLADSEATVDDDDNNEDGNDDRNEPAENGSENAESASDSEVESNEYSYATSPMLWLAPQPVVAAEQGRVRLISGEEFVFSQRGYQLLEWNHEHVTIGMGEAKIEIPVSEVVLLVTETPGS